MNDTKINYSHKKLVGKQHTWNEKQWYEEEDGVIVFQHANELWVDTIVFGDETTIKKYDNFELTMDKTVQNRLAFKVVDDTQQRGFIPPSYGLDFTVKIFIDGKKIPTSHPCQPLFDYTNGILSFETPPPNGAVTIEAYQYMGKTLSHYIDDEQDTVIRGIVGLDNPEKSYIIQHNLNSYDILNTIYTYEDIDGTKYWKQDTIPLILLDENRLQIELSEKLPIRFIIKSFTMK